MLYQHIKEVIIKNTKQEVKSLIDKLPDDCTLEDIQYHMYVVEKIQRGIETAESEGNFSQNEVKRKFSTF